MEKTAKLSNVDDPQELALVQEVSTLELQADHFMIAGEGDLITATNILGSIAAGKKRLEEQRKFLVKPLNDHVKAINDRFRTYSDPLERADGIVRRKVMTFRQEQEKKRREEQERLRQLAEKEQAKLARKAEKKGLPEPEPIIVPTIMSAPKTVQADFGTTSIKKVWAYEIINEAEIPREYFSLDEKKIAAVVKAGVRNIPGVRIFENEQLAVRAK